ncbi:flagellar hook-basal body complex protein [Helicobacter cappadocius]|uniref:Flagellar hook protein FlgE n=1 Tax=Helicobacter cappadocius TaxID=3063998 RepID=A0AA90Q0E9_9HELI|nr:MULTISPECIES: flagellar hook-basal body complex protein [unclassified Helicobacter]MDO7253861.1 flagellar hook-basal body complex protein [Helicobacter sp. faydin-H75]MDP2539793.1 flagellar hook-basal body complex protein [Helicobacter sp. faydin-H76]
MNDTILNSYSGIKTHQFGLDSISNNIANVNTTGYRENIPEFKSLFSTHLESLGGSSAISNDRNFGSSGASNAISTKSGNYHQTDGEFDMAYQGKGWFIVGPNQKGDFKIDKDGYEQKQANYFTRDGAFSRDADGYLVNSEGYYVYGINLDKIKNGVFVSSNDNEKDLKELSDNNLKPLNIPQELKFQPVLTSQVNISVNLNPKSNFQNAQDVFLDPSGKLIEDKFKNQDMNALANNDEKSLDTSIYDDISFKISKDGKDEEYDFKYGSGGEKENEFRTIGDLQKLLKDKTGLDLDVSRDKNGDPKKPLSLSIINNTADMNLSIGGKMAQILGLNAAEIPLKKGSSQDSNPIKVPFYSTSTEIYDKDGKKFLLKSDYVMQDSGDNKSTPPINQKWEVKTAVYDFKGDVMVSKKPVTQTIEFDSDGNMIADDAEVDFKDNKIKYSLKGSKDYKSSNLAYQDSKLTQVSQDGKPEGALREIRVDSNGIIYLAFSNGVTEAMGRVGIAAFVNDQGLRKVGGNLLEMTSSTVNGDNKLLSGNPILGWNEDGVLKFGKVMYKNLETSNVDVGNALTNLILMQRGYSMNAKAFTTGDDLIKEAINLKK